MTVNSNYKITAIGTYIPEKKLTNFDFEKMIETSDEWIVKRTGIHERYIAADDQFASDLAIKSVQNMVENYSSDLSDVDVIITSAFVPDHLTPSISALVAGHFGIHKAGTYDLHAACSGFAYGFITANSYIVSGQAKKVLLIAAETPSKVVDYSDRGTCILFGDAGAAVLIEKGIEEKRFVSAYGTDGDLAEKVYCSLFSPKVKGTPVLKNRLIEQNGKALYAYIIKNISVSIRKLLEDAEMTVTDIDYFVPHSANLRLIDALCETLNIEKTKMLTSVEQYGNTSSASIPLAISLAVKDGRVKKGDKLLIFGFGGGLTYAGAIIEW